MRRFSPFRKLPVFLVCYMLFFYSLQNIQLLLDIVLDR